jgi:hypothetical protein
MDPGMSLDLYCERLWPGLLAEPLNALSNGAFFVAAGWIWARSRRRRDRGLGVLAVLVLAIGIGSSLFHTLATTGALLADVLPILLFQLVFLWLYLRRNACLSRSAAGLLTALFLAAGLASRSLGGVLNGSLSYAPALGVLLLLGLHQRRTASHEPWLLLGAAALFTLSLGFRTVDPMVCAWLPSGTHLLWHLLNAVVLALTARSLLPPRGGTAAGQTGARAWQP